MRCPLKTRSGERSIGSRASDNLTVPFRLDRENFRATVPGLTVLGPLCRLETQKKDGQWEPSVGHGCQGIGGTNLRNPNASLGAAFGPVKWLQL